MRAVRGPTTFDRILAVNAMGTIAVLLIAVSGFLTGRPDWLDLALIYALLNFIGTLAVLKFIRYRNLGLDGGLERRHQEEMFPWKPPR
ncbi:MAG: pH regulation protein F [Candidatus Dadabacteria bacterium]|nr:MAG: pH regulation protein F [Candidatus Dadabacteria bacterium]